MALIIWHCIRSLLKALGISPSSPGYRYPMISASPISRHILLLPSIPMYTPMPRAPYIGPLCMPLSYTPTSEQSNDLYGCKSSV